MAASNTKISWIKNYVQEKFCGYLQRIKCSEIRKALDAQFGEINDNEMGAIVRQAFPGVIRKRSNSINYYENISFLRFRSWTRKFK